MKNNIITKKIGVKLLFTIAFSLCLSILASLEFAKFIVNNYLLSRKDSITIVGYNLLALTLFLVGMLVFIFTFLLIINREIKYIKYIANQVSKFAHEDFGVTLEVRGNDELAELCKNINFMSTELKSRIERERAIEKTKTELITNVSHDLRTPLTAIIGYLDILKKDDFNDLDEVKEHITSTYNLSIKLKKLIDELFEYTKLSSHEVSLQLENVDICSILNQILGEYIPVLESKGLKIISLIPDSELMVDIDIEKIVRVFDNILSNAEKYSYKPSDILVSAENSDEAVILSFSNKGEHISQDKLNQMFERFYRVDTSRSSAIEGSGLGLAISKKIIELHDGEIWAESHDDIITFKIKLKLAK